MEMQGNRNICKFCWNKENISFIHTKKSNVNYEEYKIDFYCI